MKAKEVDELLKSMICCDKSPDCNCLSKRKEAHNHKRSFKFFIRRKSNPEAKDDETHTFHAGSATWLKEMITAKIRHYERLDLEVYKIDEVVT